MSVAIINPWIPPELEMLLLPAGQLVAVPAAELARFGQEQLSAFCHKHAVYQLPTTELIQFLAAETGSRCAIEIGAGNGSVGRALRIPRTDSHLQQSNEPGVTALYDRPGQPRIVYPPDVEKLTAQQAVAAYRPQVVIGCWITERYRSETGRGMAYGVDEQALLEQVETYIHVGNKRTHGGKGILRRAWHRQLQPSWLYSRSMHKGDNIIYVFKGLNQ